MSLNTEFKMCTVSGSWLQHTTDQDGQAFTLPHPSVHGCGPLWEGAWPWATLPTVSLPWTQPLKGLTAESHLLTALPSRSWAVILFRWGIWQLITEGKPNT